MATIKNTANKLYRQADPGERSTNRLTVQEYEDLKAMLYPVKCSTCDDKKIVSGSFPLGHRLFGKMFPCPSCARNEVYSEPDINGLLPIDYYLGWDDILEIGDNADRIREIKEYVQKMIDRRWGLLYLWGHSGTAKSEIGRVAVATSLRNNVASAYLSMFDLLNYMYSGPDDKSNLDQRLASRMNEIEGVRLLVLDEFEKVYTDKRGNNLVSVFHVINKRYDWAMRQKSGITIVISNKPPEHLAEQGEEGVALLDRFLDSRGSIMSLLGDSLRPMADRLDILKEARRGTS